MQDQTEQCIHKIVNKTSPQIIIMKRSLEETDWEQSGGNKKRNKIHEEEPEHEPKYTIKTKK